ncbi:MAG: hypothetical protein AB7S68_36950, partial [Polyangiaceae bacterium]
GVYWPEGVHPHDRVEDWAAALATRGFSLCEDGHLETDRVKVAIYALSGVAKHAARQLKDGRWVSKLGDDHDVIHDTPDCVGGGAYGEPVCFLARPRTSEDE